jgi:thiamine kinase-like enzyme
MEELVQNTLRQVFEDDSIIYDRSRMAGGLTNYNYIMEIKGNEYVVRQPGGMTNLMIDRKIEKVNNALASELGINSECVYFDELSGIKISVSIKNSRNIAQADPNNLSNLKAVSDVMKKVHTSRINFPNVFDWLAELDKYEQIIQELNGGFFLDYSELKEMLLDYMNKNMKNIVSVPCHNDTVPENFILDEVGRTYLVDWEYSGMNDPSWDVAAYILESKLSPEAIDFLLREYYGGYPDTEEVTKIKCFMMAQDLLWMVWAMIRHYSGDDFLDYCLIRYERFRKNIKAITRSEDYGLAEMVNN